MRLTDTDALLKKLEGVWDCNDMVFKPNDHICNVPNDCKGCKWRETLDFVKRIVKSSKTVDAVQVVRCKDCKYYVVCGKLVWCELYDSTKSENGFCDMGKRKDGEQDSAD